MRKFFKVLIGVLVVLGVVVGALMLFARQAGGSAYYPAGLPRPLLIAHQGGDGLWPGNTLYAFEHAAALGVDVFETDIRMTKDGVIVISHDEKVENKSNGKGRVQDLTYAELQALDAGYNWSADEGKTFPFRGQGITYTSLDAVFKAFPNMRFNIDMKQTAPPVEEAFCQVIRQNNMQDKVLAASFTHANNAAFRKICPEVTTSGDQTETTVFVFLNFALLGRTYSPEFKAFQVPVEQYNIPVVTQSFVNAAHERNLRVDVWTIDDPLEMRSLVALGVDGIITDRPDLLKEVLRR
jgi:glycerophosphoryl diester phosphodiesterase